MTTKELGATALGYRELARECLTSDAPYAMIVGVCGGIAKEPCYNHHERGQRLWAFFKALDDVKAEG